MTNSMAVRMGGEPDFVAHVFRGDNASADRVWVCLRGTGATSASSWLGCWSSKSGPPSSGDVKQFLDSLAQKVRTGGRIGPFGPYLDGHYFFEGWDSWGVGLPGPITSMTPTVVTASVEAVTDLADFCFEP
jgi:hypothetical protein